MSVEKDIDKLFQVITELPKEGNVFEDLLDPNRVFNVDDTNFRIFFQKSRKFAKKGSKDVY